MPILWRAYGSRACVALTPEWQEVTSLAADGQVSALFTRGGTRRYAIVYAVVSTDSGDQSRRVATGRAAWLPGNGVRRVEARRSRVGCASDARGWLFAGDDPEGARFLARLSIERFERTAGGLADRIRREPREIVRAPRHRAAAAPSQAAADRRRI